MENDSPPYTVVTAERERLDDHAWEAVKALVSGLVAARDCDTLMVIGAEDSRVSHLSSFLSVRIVDPENQFRDLEGGTFDAAISAKTIVLCLNPELNSGGAAQAVRDAIGRWHDKGALILRLSGSSTRLRNPFLRQAEFARFKEQIPIEPLISSLLAPPNSDIAPRIAAIYHRAVSGRISRVESADALSGDLLPPVAIVSSFNEEDIIEETVLDLIDQGCEVVALDNWSTDGTWEILQNLAISRPHGLIRVERFPQEPPVDSSWRDILAKKEEIALEYIGRWILHTDADELRRSPFPNLNLAQSLFLAQSLGANRINFSILNFRPVHGGPPAKGRIESDLEYFDLPDHQSYFWQRKAWIQPFDRVNLVSSGGHTATFSDARDFIYNFWLKHYPIRSSAHGSRKLYVERMRRWDAHECGVMGWHVHYREFSPDDSFIWAADSLHHFNDKRFFDEFGLSIMTKLWEHYSSEMSEKRIGPRKWANPTLSRDLIAVSQKLEDATRKLEDHAARLMDLEGFPQKLEDHAARLMDLEGFPQKLEDHAARLTDLEGFPQKLEDHAARLMDLEGFLAYMTARYATMSRSEPKHPKIVDLPWFGTTKSKSSLPPSVPQQAYDAVCNSVFFDAEFYLRAYPDVAASGMDPALHYLLHGGAEGRNPGPYFSTNQYFAQNPDVAAAGINALVHYELHGRDEGRWRATNWTANVNRDKKASL